MNKLNLNVLMLLTALGVSANAQIVTTIPGSGNSSVAVLSNSAAASNQLQSMIKAKLAAKVSLIGQTAISSQDLQKIQQFYSLRSAQAVWTDLQGLNSAGIYLVDVLQNQSVENGLLSSFYMSSDITQRMNMRDVNSLAELDILMTQSYLTYASDLSTGRLNPKDKTQNISDLEMVKNKAPLIKDLQDMTASIDTLEQGLQNLIPPYTDYKNLVYNLSLLKYGKSIGGWPAFSLDNPKLKIGSKHANVIALRVRLVDLGFLPREERLNISPVFDAVLQDGVIRFQKAYLLGSDGVVGGATYKALSMSLESAIDQVRMNLEKWRYMPRLKPNRYFLVDMARQELDIMEGEELIDNMRVVIGKEKHETPMMSDSASQIIVNPYWYPTDSIIIKEIIPKMLQNPMYLDNMHMEILDGKNQPLDYFTIASTDWTQYNMNKLPPYTFRQQTGLYNSLGVIKVELSNGHAIYMHDTDDRSVFSNSVRYLSHGCIRLQRPIDVAVYLLKNQDYKILPGADTSYTGWFRSNDITRDDVINAVNSGVKAYKVPIKSIPVYTLGTTTVTFEDGSIFLGPDVYEMDLRMNASMNGSPIPVTMEAQDVSAP